MVLEENPSYNEHLLYRCVCERQTHVACICVSVFESEPGRQSRDPCLLCVCADSVRVCVPRHAYFIIKDLWLNMHSMIFSIFTFPGRCTVNDLCAQCML